MIDSILLTVARVSTYYQQQSLSIATSFFFERDFRLYLVTSRHVLFDAPSNHRPDRIEIELHRNPGNLAASVWFSIPLYRNGTPLWRQGSDSGGEIDIAVIEVDKSALPPRFLYQAFTPAHLPTSEDHIEVGSLLAVVGFPMGFHDDLHHLPVARQATLASSFGFRFKGEGYFLTDARTHRGISGSPVVIRDSNGSSAGHPLPWKLLGVHSTRLDVGTRDLVADEALGLNCAWFSGILMQLTEPGAQR